MLVTINGLDILGLTWGLPFQLLARSLNGISSLRSLYVEIWAGDVVTVPFITISLRPVRVNTPPLTFGRVTDWNHSLY